MTRKREWIVSAVLVSTAVVTAATYSLLRADAQVTGGSGHQHAASASVGAGPVRLTAESARRIGVTYATAELGPMTTHIRTVGQVTFDQLPDNFDDFTLHSRLIRLEPG